MDRSSEVTPSGPSSRRVSPWRAAGVLLVVLTALAGAALIVLAQRAPARLLPPQPVAEVPTSAPSQRASATPAVGMARSAPMEIRIPKIGLKAKVVEVGLDANGSIEVPPLEQAQLAGWYRLGPSPGEVGNAIVVGHVDSYAMGPAVFFYLGSLRAGDAVEIRRQDGTVARFRVDRVASYPKTDFPTDLVYADSDEVGLRLITCGGVFDRSARSYLNNIIVFASLAT